MSGRNLLNALAAGFAGACALTILHELLRRGVPRAPRLDILGMRSVSRSMKAMKLTPPRRLRRTSLASDIVANTTYYSLVGAAGPQNALLAGSLLGAGAGIGSVLLPKPLGLGEGPTDRTVATQIMTLGLYVAGGVLAATAYRRLD